MPARRSDRALLAIAGLWLAVQVSPLWYPTADSGAYLSIARGLARDGTLQSLGYPQVYYPLGYPLVIAPLFLAGGEPFLPISLLHFALGVAVLLLTYCWVRGIAPEHAAWVAALTVGNVSFGNVYRRPLSETAFMTAVLAGVLVLNRAARLCQCAESGWPGLSPRSPGFPPEPGLRGLSPGHPSWIACGSMLAVVAVLIRPAGAALAAGLTAVLALAAWRGEWPRRRTVLAALAVGLPAALAQAGVMVYDRVQATAIGGLGYTQQVRDPGQSVAGQLLEGVRLRVQETGRLLVPGMYKAYARAGTWRDPNLLVYGPLAVAVLWGWLRLVRERRDVFAWLVPFYLGVYLVWPFDQGTRFFTPLWPLLAVCLLTLTRGIHIAAVRRAGIGLVAAHLLVAAAYWQFDERPQALALQGRRAELEQLAGHIPAADRAAVAADERVGGAWLWVQYRLDRRLMPWSPGTPLPSQARVVLARAADAPPAGWAADAASGSYCLWRRLPAGD